MLINYHYFTLPKTAVLIFGDSVRMQATFEVYSLTKCLQKLHLQFGPSQVFSKFVKISRVSADLREFGK